MFSKTKKDLYKRISQLEGDISRLYDKTTMVIQQTVEDGEYKHIFYKSVPITQIVDSIINYLDLEYVEKPGKISFTKKEKK